jgi:capsular polysaccharide biosynthesis protein
MAPRRLLAQLFAKSPLIELRDRARRRSLDELGRASGLSNASHGSDTLRRIEAAIGHRDLKQIAVIATQRPEAVGAIFARRYPGAQVHVLDARRLKRPSLTRRRVTLHHASTLDAMHQTLSTLPSLQVLIESTRGKKLFKTASLRHLLFHLQDDGVYIVDRLDTMRDPSLQNGAGLDVWQALSRILRVKIDPGIVQRDGLHADELARAEAIESVTNDGNIIVVRKSGKHVLRVRDEATEAVLSGRHGSGWGHRMTSREPLSLRPRGRAHANMLEETFRTEFNVPRLYLREYRDVVCAPRQLAVQGDVVLPVSFHHGLGTRLLTRSPLLKPTGSHFARLDDSTCRAPRLPGAYYHLDSEFPGHFGHFMTEDIAKLWGWSAAQAEHTDLKILVSTLQPGSGPSAVQRVLLEAWGIPASDIVCIDRPVSVDLLHGATQMFYNGLYVHPELLDIWSRLREALRTPDGERTTTPRRIFVTRDPNGLRPCRNADQVEELFAEYGFDIVRPEQLTIRQQVDIFADADVIAGFGGSGLFGAVYSTRPGRRIVISSTGYLARNEWAIAGIKGDDYHHFFGEPEVRPADTDEKWRAFQSPYSFDFARDGAALTALLRD